MSGVKLNVTRREALKIDLTIEKAAGGRPEGNHERIWSILEYCCCWEVFGAKSDQEAESNWRSCTDKAIS